MRALLITIPQVYVPPHPLVKHWLAVARNAATPTPIFRSALAELGRILIYEAVREFLPTVDGVIDTPLGPADVTCVDPMRPVKARKQLRACVCGGGVLLLWTIISCRTTHTTEPLCGCGCLFLLATSVDMHKLAHTRINMSTRKHTLSTH